MKKIAFLLTLLTLVTLETKGQDDKDAFIDPEQIASFPGGNDSLIYFINKNLVKPTRSNKKGNVYVSFIVNVDGTLTDFKMEKGLSTKHDESALEVGKKNS